MTDSDQPRRRNGESPSDPVSRPGFDQAADPTAPPRVEPDADVPTARTPGTSAGKADGPAEPPAADPDTDLPPELREPSKDELEESLEWPSEADGDDAAAAPIAPKRAAIVAVSILGAIMLALSIVGFTTDVKAVRQSQIDAYPAAQMNFVLTALTDAKVTTFSDDQKKAITDSWSDDGLNTAPTADQLLSTINGQASKEVTSAQLTAALKDKKASIDSLKVTVPTEAQLRGNVNTQSFIFVGAALLAGLSAFFYARRAKWARILGMVVSGLVIVMFLMQVLNGALNLPVIVILLAGAASFFLLLRGRLTPVVTPGPGMGLGGLFRPRPRN